MSDETAQALVAANAELVARRAEADILKRECLATVARGVSGRVEEFVKKAAHQHPEVAKELGAEGLKRLRLELADASAAVASVIDAATEQINWPPNAGSSRVRDDDVHSALFKFLYGERLWSQCDREELPPWGRRVRQDPAAEPLQPEPVCGGG
ncbi:hypothetical protein [Nocardia altamirensis]|uniref:hypothetical protein n=1 Tax=Nocardia altamirensis TaxID=472158 RepID=UPI00114D250B|nr:hypothetical protein [Nocardia altamirensis]